MSFWGELKRRNVFKVGAAYAIVAWLLAQIASLAFPAFHMPQWTVTFVMSLLIIGFPLILLFAWAFEITPDGIKRTRQVPLEESITHVTGRKLNYVLAALLVIAVGYIVIDKVFVSRGPVENETEPFVAEQAAPAPEAKEEPKTIAVLPFVNLSSDPEQEYFVDGLSEELLNCLAKIPDLSVTSRTSSFYFKGTKKKLQDIADELGVGHILEGSVRKSGNTLRITTQLIRAADDAHLWSETYNRELKDIFDIQEDIATAVVKELKMTLGIGQWYKQLGGTDNVDAYELYLVAKGQFFNFEIDQSLESIKAAIALDPEFALAWALKAFTHWWGAVIKPAKLSATEQDDGLKAAQKAIEIEPNLGQGHLSLGTIKLVRGDFIGAESAYRKAMDLPAETSWGTGIFTYIRFLAVGNLEKAHENIKAARQNDPFNKDVRAFYLLSLGCMDNIQQAEEEYERGKALFKDQWLRGDVYMMHIRLGSKDILSPTDIPEEPRLEPLLSAMRTHLESPENALKEMKRILQDHDDLSAGQVIQTALFAAHFGDLEFAMDTTEKSVGIEASGVGCVWFPVMQEVRRLPRFKEFVREIGLVDYWEQFGWPDICHPLDDGDFVCD